MNCVKNGSNLKKFYDTASFSLQFSIWSFYWVTGIILYGMVDDWKNGKTRDTPNIQLFHYSFLFMCLSL
jgi:hypothetical protein